MLQEMFEETTNVMDGVHTFKVTTLRSSSLEHEGFNPIPNAYIDYGPCR